MLTGYLEAVFQSDFKAIRDEGDSGWKDGGGRGVWSTIKDLFLHISSALEKPTPPHGFRLENVDATIRSIRRGEYDEVRNTPHAASADLLQYLRDSYLAENIFAQIRADASGDDTSVLGMVRCLRRTLALVEAEMMSRGVVTTVTEPKDPPPVGGQVHMITAEEMLNKATLEDVAQTAATVSIPQRSVDVRITTFERIVDGLPATEEVPWPFFVTHDATGGQWSVADRNVLLPDEFEHLPRLRVELNNKEFEELERCYKSLYRYIESGCKFVLREQYRNRWGMQ